MTTTSGTFHILLSLALTSILTGTAWAFADTVPVLNATAIPRQCQTACHQPENLRQARLDKNRQAECRQCHTGAVPALPALSIADLGKKIEPAATPTTPARQLLAAKKAPPQTSGKKPAPAAIPANMAWVGPGEFVMGSNDRWDDESPEYVERTGPFFIDLYETTNQDYQKFTSATAHPAPYHWPEGKIPQGKEKHPVVYVNWFDADAYCKWTGKRLPTEEEWEKAARGEDGRTYPWGNEWNKTFSNNPYRGSTGTEPVGSYPQGRSPYGLYDMSGNVWEWVDSHYLPHPGNTKPNPEYGKDKRILKGGSWFDCLSYGCGLSAPAFNRSFFTPEVKNNSFGFRCAKSP
jgi:formylglycine-generating enzyme required for sulfatase activity